MKTTVFGMVFFLAVALQAQEERKMNYIFEGRDISISGFGGPVCGFSALGDDFAFLMGGGGAVMFNQRFFFGGYGMGLTTQHEMDVIDLVDDAGESHNYFDQDIAFGHGGFWLGYVFQPEKPVHFGLSSKIGWGSISLLENHEIDKDFSFAVDNVFVLNPQLEIEMNLFRWFKMNVGAGYSMVSGIGETYRNSAKERTPFYKSSDFNKPVLNISFLFGGFGN